MLGQLVLHVLRDDVWMQMVPGSGRGGSKIRPSGRDAPGWRRSSGTSLTKNEAYVCGWTAAVRLQRQPVKRQES